MLGERLCEEAEMRKENTRVGERLGSVYDNSPKFVLLFCIILLRNKPTNQPTKNQNNNNNNKNHAVETMVMAQLEKGLPSAMKTWFNTQHSD